MLESLWVNGYQIQTCVRTPIEFPCLFGSSEIVNVTTFARKVVSLSSYRKVLHGYLVAKMGVVAPNLAALIGEIVAARLISHSGSQSYTARCLDLADIDFYLGLTNLSKYPASTVQILGAEKALFRALKTKGNTRKLVLCITLRHFSYKL